MSVMAAYIVPHPPLIVPEVGKGQESKIQSTIDAYHSISKQIAELKPETVVIISPHSVMYQDYIHISPGSTAVGDMKQFGAEKTRIRVDYDSELARAVEELAEQERVAAGTLGERDKKLDHGTMVPLWFIDQYLKDYRVIRVSISGLTPTEHYRLGKCIKGAAEKLLRRVVVVASGDLSHRLKEDGPYGFAEEGPVFDQLVTKAMSEGDFLSFMRFNEEFCEGAAECGLRSFITMAGTLDGEAVNPRLLSYEGPFGVGYAVAAFYPALPDESRHLDLFREAEMRVELEQIRKGEGALVALARRSLETYVREGKKIDMPPGLPEEIMGQRAGVFVSIKKGGRLRGCIGTIAAVEDSIAAEIIRNAVSAGTGDPRFDSVTVEELNELVYSVDVLGKPEPIKSIDELDVLRYGVIVTHGRKRGLLLPNLDGVTTPQQQVEIALQKAGIPPRADYSMERFEVVRHQ